jgi:hypothetical protein
MSKALIVAFRDRRTIDGHSFGALLSAAMAPNNLKPVPPRWFQEGGVISFVFNPSVVVRTKRAGICLGRTTRCADNDLFRVGAGRPDGTFALFRADHRRIEASTDYAGSRTVWYLVTPELFVAATSQRMILAIAGSFEFNPLCVKWLLSSGTTGPGVSWDKRVRMIEPNSSVTLDRDTWTVECVQGGDFRFAPEDRPFAQHREALLAAVETSMRDLDFRVDRWALALSGGMDSRALLYFLKGRGELNLITWGTEEALGRRNSDACIAGRLAMACRLPHRYFAVQSGRVSFEKTLERFLQAGEGRVDHFSGYLDGLSLWTEIAGTGRGVLRGYDAFGRKPPVHSEYQVRRANTLLIGSDYLGAPIPPEFAVNESDIPERLGQRAAEPLEDWRDRLWLEHRTPNVTAALDEIKTPYVEIANPLLCRRVIDVVRRLPRGFRSDKTIFASIVRAMFRSIPFATCNAIQDYDDVLEQAGTTAFFEEVLRDDSGDVVLPATFRATICKHLNSHARMLSLRRRAAIAVKANLPRSLENLIRRHIPREPMNFKRLAARAVIAIQMHRILTRDARLRLSEQTERIALVKADV